MYTLLIWPCLGLILNLGVISSEAMLNRFITLIVNRSRPCLGHFISIRMLASCSPSFVYSGSPANKYFVKHSYSDRAVRTFLKEEKNEVTPKRISRDRFVNRNMPLTRRWGGMQPDARFLRLEARVLVCCTSAWLYRIWNGIYNLMAD